jgi:hypothetical protein
MELKSRVLDLIVLPALAAAREAAFEELNRVAYFDLGRRQERKDKK